MGTFLLNNRYATVLFNSGSDKSFVNTSFIHLIDIDPVRLDTSYEVELADERLDYFYKNYHNYGLDPHDDDEDVQSEAGNLIKEMRLKNVDSLASVNDGEDDAPGHFNVFLNPSESSTGSSYVSFGMDDFKSYLNRIEACDLVMYGLKFTWNKSLGKVDGLLKKLDRVLSNCAFMDKFSNENEHFFRLLL
nr:RNA-directed DNA polymerase, eukaryota, reverse transcriptase zinc-binding domain protein [Tanacetum cinerariifolium]